MLRQSMASTSTLVPTVDDHATDRLASPAATLCGTARIALEGAMWVVTQNDSRPGEAPETAVARAQHLGRWPWEVTGWQVCGRNDIFLDQPKMAFSLMLPAAELIVQAPALDGAVSTCGFRRSGFVHERVAFRRTGDTDDPGITSLWIFWMPKQGRWLLANVKPGGTGVQSVVARSLADDGSTWACFWPWEVEAEGWESPTADTIGLEDADAIWVPNRDIAVRLASPAIVSLLDEQVTLKYRDEEGDLCTLTAMTTEDFLFRPGMSCSEEVTPYELVVQSAQSMPSSEEAATAALATPFDSVESDYLAKEDTNPLRSLGPVALLACLKGMHSSGRLSAEVLASLILQFLPILAQRVQRKQEKINRKGVKMRQHKSLMQLIKSICIHFQTLPGTSHILQSFAAYLAGNETQRLGDTLAELLRCLVSCKSRSSLAAALVAVARDILLVLPCLFPETFQEGHPSPCAEWAAALVGAPVHEDVVCGRCGTSPIVGPCFQGTRHSLCGVCFVEETVHGKAEGIYSCRLAPEGYNKEAAFDDPRPVSFLPLWQSLLPTTALPVNTALLSFPASA
ncbi:Dipeptidyl peptidase 8 [Durusdinium trenchii]|uniref:Dipeptidyl peptidase 8 n=1 Tax=Durusdinium trenchii TaxID=1381693 RepID=A0ABP0KIH4_9DINO